ncbi:MAG: putative K(+)-stimulated pyrophosphate-energized sodium pump [Verrucomicrobiae bacterium]|nr:putative K(+)-stimulated pyrophosphate-energized sodium pump [Verrucomicrobiae bacterium]
MITKLMLCLFTLGLAHPAWAAISLSTEKPAIPPIWWVSPIGALVALAAAAYFYTWMKKQSEGDATQIKIAGHVRAGALAYLKQQYKVVAIVFAVVFVLLAILAFGLGVQEPIAPFAFLTGGLVSGLTGFIGMKTATFANNRTAAAAKNSLNDGLKVAFRSGAVMGLNVVGFGVLAISIWFYCLYTMTDFGIHKVTVALLSYSFGASLQALFARVGGGIFTKAADVGADLVGKVEAGIPEDDPRNPATIADNVGDNVGDVAGMGADLYESFCGAILAAAALGAAAFIASNTELAVRAAVLPMVIAGIGTVLSVVGVLVVRTKEGATQKQLLASLARGVNLSSLLIVVASYFTVKLLLPEHFGVFWSIVSGLVAGLVIAKATEYYTAADFKPTQFIANQAKTGPATVIIAGIAVGFLSTWIPVIATVVGIIVAYGVAGGFGNMEYGLYGIGVAAVGMLSTLGITLATDAYGPIADNAGGNAEMSHQPPFVRERTDALDSLGNTTAATGKGFAIGSAALTALALLAAFMEEVRVSMARGMDALQAQAIVKMPLDKFVEQFDITLLNPTVLAGIFIGAMLVCVFCALTMLAVGRAAGKMVEEVRRQFKEIVGIMDGKAEPDYASCVAISTQGAQREMVLPSILAVVVPVVTGMIFGVAGVLGLLVGGLSTGFLVAVTMANAGGAWDNAKKYIESGQLGGKRSDAHKAAVVGDTVGDPFKDTSGPSLNILIKLMSIVSIVVAGVVVKVSPVVAGWLHMTK